MIHAYLERGGEGRLIDQPDPAALQGAVWIDLFQPDEQERTVVERLHREALPEPDEVDEIEATSRTYQDPSGLHLHLYFLNERQGRAALETVAFTVTDQRLISLRDADLSPFRWLRRRLRHAPPPAPTDILLELVESALDRLADRVERGHAELEEASRLVLSKEERRPEAAIDRLTQLEDVNGKIRLCLMDMQRALLFLLRRGPRNEELQGRVREVLRDIESLLPHTDYLFEKTNFLMDAALGFINVEQNQIIKIFSIAAVVFLPPTLVASIYGMNFRHMPELSWPWGYPLALALMILSGIAPYLYFKRKGWL